MYVLQCMWINRAWEINLSIMYIIQILDNLPQDKNGKTLDFNNGYIQLNKSNHVTPPPSPPHRYKYHIMLKPDATTAPLSYEHFVNQT